MSFVWYHRLTYSVDMFISVSYHFEWAEEKKLAANEQEKVFGKDSQINVVLSPDMNGAGTVDLVNVFHNMKVRRRFFAWVLLLCMLMGVSAMLLVSQFTKPMATVSSLVTYDYEVIEEEPEQNRRVAPYPVKDLTAPDGKPLDLEQITSAYVLQQAIDMTPLSEPITVEALRRNMLIQRNLTEDSKRKQEVAAQMVTDKNNAAYTTVQGLELEYENKVVVSLTNGFSTDEESISKTVLPDDELKALLNNILNAYNDFMVLTYADKKLPDDAFSVIDTESMDFLESLDMMRTAVDNLYEYCEAQPENIRTQRSIKTGLSLEDLMQTLSTVRSVNVDYLYSYVYTNSLTRDSATILTNYLYQLRLATNNRDQIESNIATTQAILDTYKNDEIYVSMQDSDTSRSTKTTTDYYNELVLAQAENYDKLAEIEVQITDINGKISNLTGSTNTQADIEVGDELTNTLERCKQIYQMIRDYMTEIFNGSASNMYAIHSTAYGKTPGFIQQNLKYVLIGLVVGAVLACGCWFMSGLITEMKRGKHFDDIETEANV